MELSVGKETGWADIGLSELLVPIGKKPADLYAVDRHKAAGWVTEAAILRAGEMLREGKLDGIIGFGGSMGASISSAVMQSLPIGVPKMLVTTIIVRERGDGAVLVHSPDGQAREGRSANDGTLGSGG